VQLPGDQDDTLSEITPLWKEKPVFAFSFRHGAFAAIAVYNGGENTLTRPG
jgi:hypothetical protein